MEKFDIDEDTLAYKEACDVYEDFENELKYGNRFFISEEISNIFEDIISEHSELIDPNEVLYRARIHENNAEEPYVGKDIGMPPIENCGAGRLNSKGIRVLYLAGSENAAIAEVRPNIGNKLTIGKFKTNKYLNIVRFERGISTICFRDKWKSGKSNDFISYFSLLLSNGFSKIINSKEKDLDYLPTQAFADCCKKHNIDGIVFPSSVYDKVTGEYFKNKIRSDYNCVLFKDDGVEFVDSELIEIKDIEYSY